jgi:hypothetical protein
LGRLGERWLVALRRTERKNIGGTPLPRGTCARRLRKAVRSACAGLARNLRSAVRKAVRTAAP